MSRVTNAVLGSTAYGRGSAAAMLDLSYGGQQGYAPNLVEIVSNQAYIRKNLICILLEAPKFFQLMPDPAKWVQSLKALFELHCRTIEGFNAGLTVDFDEHNVGGAGEMQQEVTDVKRARSEPVFGFVEKYGMPIQTFLYYWITYGMMDPDTKYALAGTLSQPPSDMLLDWYTATALFIEPDPTHTKVMKSWVTTNMMPKGTGEIIGKRDLTAASEVLQLSVEFTGISQFGLGTNVFAQNILNTLNLTNANPYLRPSFIQGINSDVAAANVSGYREEIASLASQAVTGGANISGSATAIPKTGVTG
jgi:hypothetical protein